MTGSGNGCDPGRAIRLGSSHATRFRFSDATVHRACFVVWDRRKAFIAHFNRVARSFVAEDGAYLQMSSEGELVQHLGAAPPRGPAA